MVRQKIKDQKYTEFNLAHWISTLKFLQAQTPSYTLYRITFNLHHPFILTFQVSNNVSRKKGRFKGFIQAGAAQQWQTTSIGLCLEQSFQYSVCLHFPATFRACVAHFISWLCWLNLDEVVICILTSGKVTKCFKASQATTSLFSTCLRNSVKTYQTRTGCSVLWKYQSKRDWQTGSRQTRSSWLSSTVLMAWAVLRILCNYLAVGSHCHIPNSV